MVPVHQVHLVSYRKSVLALAIRILVLCGARNRHLELYQGYFAPGLEPLPAVTERAIVTGMGSNRNPLWSFASLIRAFDEMAAFRTRAFAKVGERPHVHSEKVNWATFDCAECIKWQKRFDAAFKEELDKLNNR